MSEPLTESEVLNLLYEELHQPLTLSARYYYPRENRPAEMYVEIDGECWRITATQHPHPALEA